MFPSGRETLNSLVTSVLNKGTGVAISGTPWEKLMEVVEQDSVRTRTVRRLQEVYELAGRSLTNVGPDYSAGLLEDGSNDVAVLCEGADSPNDLLAFISQVARSLKIGGRFIGSIASLPTNAGLAAFTVTPYGFMDIIESVGLKMERIYPGPNGMSVFLKNAPGSPDFDIRGDHMDDALTEYGLNQGGYRTANVLRLMFSATFTFDAVKPALAN